jgi:hypothetical protein
MSFPVRNGWFSLAADPGLAVKLKLKQVGPTGTVVG